MVMLDANVILRYLLNDNEEMAEKAETIIKNQSVVVTVEVIAEVVYVLKRVYSVSKEEIKNALINFLSEVNPLEPEVLFLGIETYAKKNLDFVDCILYAYHQIKNYEVITFDQKLDKLLTNAGTPSNN